MNDRDLRRYERLTRVQTIGRQYAADFVDSSQAAQILARIDQAVIQLEQAKADQRPERVDKRVPMKQLTDTCLAIATTSRAVGRNNSSFIGEYRVPKPMTENRVLTHVDALLNKLEDQPGDTSDEQAAKAGLRARFIAYELPSDFVETLRQQRELMRKANAINQEENNDGIANTRLIDTILTAAANDIKDLDAIMRNKFRSQPNQLTAWQRASRVEAAPKRASKTPDGMTGDLLQTSSTQP